MIRLDQILKQMLAGTLYYTGLLSLWGYIKQQKYGSGSCVILAYHCFLDVDNPLRRHIQPGLCVTPGNFEQQLLFFQQHYHVISMDELVDTVTQGKALPRRSLVITIDDGWRDNYTNAFPVLKKYDAPATVYLTVDYIDTAREFWFLTAGCILDKNALSADDLASVLAETTGTAKEILLREISNPDGGVNRDRFMEQLKELGYEKQAALLDRLSAKAGVSSRASEQERCTLNWDEIRQMSREGVDFGSHGLSHRIMTLLKPEEVSRELTASRDKIRERSGVEVRHFSYPNGDYNESIASSVKQAGYGSAVATGNGCRVGPELLNRYAIRRIGIHDGVSGGVTGRFSRAMLAFHLARFG